MILVIPMQTDVDEKLITIRYHDGGENQML